MTNEINLKPWKKGQSGNPGGVSKARLAFRKAFEEAITPQDIKEVAMVLMKKAKKGEPWAVKEFFFLALGKNFYPTFFIAGGVVDKL